MFDYARPLIGWRCSPLIARPKMSSFCMTMPCSTRELSCRYLKNVETAVSNLSMNMIGCFESLDENDRLFLNSRWIWLAVSNLWMNVIGCFQPLDENDWLFLTSRWIWSADISLFRQMAEGWAKHLAKNDIEIRSSGLEGSRVHPTAKVKPSSGGFCPRDDILSPRSPILRRGKASKGVQQFHHPLMLVWIKYKTLDEFLQIPIFLNTKSYTKFGAFGGSRPVKKMEFIGCWHLPPLYFT